MRPRYSSPVPEYNGAGCKPKVAYFLGNLTEHWLHAESLHDFLPGDVVVMSQKAKIQLAVRGVQCKVFDDAPEVKLKLSRQQNNTLTQLQEEYEVVFFFDVYSVPKRPASGGAWWIQLGHGVVVKDYYYTFGTDRFSSLMRDYDFIATMGPYTRNIQRRKGLPRHKLVDLGVSRADAHKETLTGSHESQVLLRRAGLDPDLLTLVYMPTFYGITSIKSLAVPLDDAVPDDINFVFRPHPETPRKLVSEVLQAFSGRKNFHYSVPGPHSPLWPIANTFAVANVIVGDMSSAFFEGGISGANLVFVADSLDLSAYQKRLNILFRRAAAIPSAFDGSDAVGLKNAIDEALLPGNPSQNEYLANELFYDLGGATSSIASFAEDLSRDARRGSYKLSNMFIWGISTLLTYIRGSLRPLKRLLERGLKD